MAAIDMRNAKIENTIGLQEHTSMSVGAEIGAWTINKCRIHNGVWI